MENDVDGDTGMGDCGVGTIVWVRRRNGSWWPGKILGPDELSASHLMSPRSGTPVKLLGREDASVDWYNLEKSKRVKPFRCGEFDDCIERAEASQGMPPKKREKYARREDAILHALELEKQVLEKKFGKSNGGFTTKLLANERKRESSCDNGNSIIDLSLDEKRKGRLSLLDNNNNINKSASQLNPDLHPPPRLRGLQDLGVGGGPISSSSSSKYKHSSLASSNGFYKHAAATDDDPQVVVTTSESKNLLGNRKRSQEEEEDEETMSKRRDRRRPLVQLLNNKSHTSTKLSSSSSSHMHHPLLQLHGDDDDSVGEEQRQVTTSTIVVGNDQGMGTITSDSFNYTETLPCQVEIPTPIVENRVDSYPVVGMSEDNNTSGSNEDTETDSSGTESLISDTCDAAMAALSDEDENIEFIPKAAFGRSELQTEDDSMSDDESAGHCPDDSGDSLLVPTSVTVSKWQLKGKRNSRSSRYAATTERKAASMTGGNDHHHWMSFKEDDIYYYGADSFDRSYGNQVVGYRPRGGLGLLDNSSSSMNWEDLTPPPPPPPQPLKGGYWEQHSIEYHDPPLYVNPYFGGDRRMRSMLIDVDVQVQSGYQREHVPMISLMSKLNDKAIVGHPIPIETLENGSSDIIIVSAAAAAADEFQMEASTLQPWRTSRRTSKCRIPRPLTFEEEDEEEEEEDGAFEYVDDDDDDDDDDDNDDESTWSINRIKGSTPRKTTLKKAQRKSTSLCNQKIRTLSSIGGSQQQQQQKLQPSLDLKDECYDEVEGGVMKPELLPTAVACIPVKLVFSRLHEELVARHQ